MQVGVWLCIDERDKNVKSLPLLNTYEVKTLGQAFKKAREEFPQHSEHSLIGKKVK